MFVNAIMYYKVKDATSAVANVDDYSGSSRLLAATTLRNILGTRNLGDILSERESIAMEMKVNTNLFFFIISSIHPKQTLDEATDPWGVQVERVEVKDVRVPEQLQRAMAAEAEAAREARAKVISAEGEHKASRALRHAAEVIVDSPAALQVCHQSSLIFLKSITIYSNFSVALSTNSEQYLCRAQQYNYLSSSHRHHFTTYEL